MFISVIVFTFVENGAKLLCFQQAVGYFNYSVILCTLLHILVGFFVNFIKQI
jgi:hypothetical protein